MDSEATYAALSARDARFDGVFFVGVTSTGIYCRPICPARTPKYSNCRFFRNAAAAEKSGFRPCLRCRPELAPGNAPVDRANQIARRILKSIDEGLADGEAHLGEIAKDFGIGERQLRRIVQAELGVSPIDLIQTRRLLLAKQLLTETELPVTQIAFASGFSSLRRFNDAFSTRYRMPPTQLRKQARDANECMESTGSSTLWMKYRAPYDWSAMLDFLSARTMKDIEFVKENSYSRTVALGGCTGWIRVTNQPQKQALALEFTHSLIMVLPALIGRLRDLFDLDARPDLIDSHLLNDPLLSSWVSKSPGLRVPGAFDPFEMAVRAILGQQITVKAATTLAGRFATTFGKPIKTPFPELSRLTPEATDISAANRDDIASLGIIGKRADTILAISRAFASAQIDLYSGISPETVIPRLLEIPGIGKWTAQYIAMRALRWPDAFPKEDIAIRNNLGGMTATEAEAMSLPWCPWRSYAVMHIWRSARKRPDKIIS